MNDLQRTDDWWSQRCGKVTASRIADVIARTKSGWGAGRANYMAELIAERLTGVVAQGYTNAAMQWGIETEPEAVSAYEFMRDTETEAVGFVEHPGIPMSGASPDRRVGSDGLVEIKCPNTATHIDTLLGAPIADKYIVQMQWQMACEQRQWVDFASYDPRLPADLALHVQRVWRDNDRIAGLEADVQTFLAELDDKLERLENIRDDAIPGLDDLETA